MCDIEEALLTAIQHGHDDAIPPLVVAGARRLDCALYLAIQLERVKAIAILLLCKATITGDCQAIRSLLSEPPDSDNVPWYMRSVHQVLAQGVVKMSYPIAVSIMEKNYEATKELLLRTDLDMRRKQVDWSKLKLTLLHSSWMYSIAPWVVSLKLVNNHLRRLPNELFAASQLRRLDLSHNLLETVSPDLFSLPHLEYLSLSHNQLKEVPDTSIWSTSLLSLDLSENNLQTLPPGIQYSSIEILNLSKNQFTTVPKCLCRIRTLTSLDLSSMPINSLPKEMENLDHLVNLNVSNANISDLPGGGILRGAIKGIFKARARSNKPCNYVKLVVLCHSDIAKAVMYNRLKQHVVNPAAIPEIDLFQWSYRPLFTKAKLFSTQKLFFNTWLIGSAYEYCTIYPCFFSVNALYVIVWDMTRSGEMREQIKLYVDLLARYVPKANILVVATLPEGMETWAELNADNLAKRLNTFFSKPVYHDLTYHGFNMLAVNPSVKEGQTDIRQRLYDVSSTMVVNGQAVIGRHFPENYFALIPILEKEQNMFSHRGKPGVLEENTLWSLFDQALSPDPPDKMELPVIIDFLQEAGFLLHHKDPNDRLDQYYFTRPEWLYNTLLRVVRHALRHSNRLVVTYNELCSLANVDWSKDVSSALVRLMMRFAIVLPLKKSQFLVPCLLPHCNLPSAYLYVGTLRRQFAPKTKALPADIWFRITCRVLSNLERITEFVNVRRKVISNDLKQASFDGVFEMNPADTEETEATDEETDTHGLQTSKQKKKFSLSRGSSEPILSQPSKGDTVATSPIDAPRKPSKSFSNDNDVDFCPLPKPPICLETESPSEKQPAAQEKGLVEEGVTEKQPAAREKGLVEEGMTEKSTESSTESGKGMYTDVIEMNSINGQPQSSKNVPLQNKAQPTEAADGKDPFSTSIPPSVRAISSNLDVPDAVRSSSLPETMRPRIQRLASSGKKRSGSQSEPICIEKGVYVWNSGIVYDRKDVKFAIYPCVCEMSTVEERGIEICSTQSTIGRIVFARLCRLVQKLLEERYSDLFSIDLPLYKHELTQLAICPICLDRKERNPTSFLVEACVHSLKDKDMHNCRYHAESISLRDLIPDYLMIDFPSAFQLTSGAFKYSESKPLHRSRGTSLYSCTFQGEDVAIKIHHQMEAKSITLPLDSIRQEMDMLSHLSHPNIVRTFGFCLQPPCVILEKAPLGNLYQKLMDSEQKITRSIRFHIGCQIASALQYLHHHNIIYRTLKASSILVWSLDFADEVSVKLANFERAGVKSPSGLVGKTYFSSYPAPEMVRYSFREEYSEKVDIYSFGILFYELITRWQPFGGVYNSDRLPVSRRPKLSGVVTTGYGSLVKLMQDCWEEDLTLRPCAAMLLKQLCRPAFQCHLATQILRDCISVRDCCFVPSVRQIWVYGEYNKTTMYDSNLDTVEGTQIFILNADNLTVQGSLELKERASSMYTVDAKVWVGMTEACVHAYDTTTFRFTDRFYLDDSVTVIADNDTYAFVGQASGHLTYYPKLNFPKESYTIEISKKPIISMMTVGDDVWLSCGNEIVTLNADEGVNEERRWEACDANDQIYALILSQDTTTLWCLVRGACTISSWCVNTGKQKGVVDLTMELNIICCELNYDPSFLRLVSLECVNDTLWLGLTCGVIVILTAEDSPEMITYFRAHKNATKVLMEIPVADRANPDNAIILSGGYGEVSSLSNIMTEQNGVIMSWQALSASEFRLLAKRHKQFEEIKYS